MHDSPPQQPATLHSHYSVNHDHPGGDQPHPHVPPRPSGSSATGWLVVLGTITLILVILLVARQLYMDAHCTTVLGTRVCQ